MVLGAFQKAKMSPQYISCIYLKNQIKYCKTCLKQLLKKEDLKLVSRPIIA